MNSNEAPLKAVSAMENFVTSALKKIRKETSNKKYKNLRDACDVALSDLAGGNGEEDKAYADRALSADEAPADKYYLPFVLACQSRNPRIMYHSLDYLQKLIAYGYLRGTGPAVSVENDNGTEDEKKKGEEKDESSTSAGTSTNANTTPPTNGTNGKVPAIMDVVVDAISSCKDYSDDSVQLQVIKALLTAISCSTCEVHEKTLLGAVRACYHIHLVSKNTVNKTTAKATLTQMLNIIFQHMERVDSEDEEDVSPISSDVSNIDVNKKKNIETSDATDPSIEPDAVKLVEEQEPPVPKTDKPDPPTASNDLPEPDNKEEVMPAPKEKIAQPQFKFKSLYHRDAYLLFCALCRLSVRHQNKIESSLDDKVVTPDPVALKGKILSLDLILSVLENSGPSFKRSDVFLYAIRQYLCPSLITNCVSTNTQVVGLSLRIFVALQSYFKDQLKVEIETFIAQIFLRILESPNSAHDHKILVLEVFMRICKDVQLLAEIFLNYDCDWDSMDLFTRIVQVLTHIATKDFDNVGSQVNPKSAAAQYSALHVMALDSIYGIVSSLSEYTHHEERLPVVTDSNNPDDVVQAAANASAKAAAKIMGSESSLNPSTTNNGFTDHSDVIEAGTTKSEYGADNKSEYDDVKSQGTSEFTAQSAVDSFQQKQKHKKMLESAVAKFNVKPKAGINYMISRKMCSSEPQSIAAVLKEYKDQFSKTKIGEYLGEEHELNLNVMYAYVDSLEFIELSIDDALRLYLEGFRLPGEAQKIDRMMEKFAAKYCQDNPNVFPSADTAYVLAYAIIMLNTDAHNPNIKPEKKMTHDDFLKNNRGIASGRDLPPEFLGEIYNRIVSNAISLKEDDQERERDKEKEATSIFNTEATLAKKKRIAYSRERQEIVSAAEMSLPFKRNKTKIEANSLMWIGHEDDSSNDHVKPMFLVLWAPVCAVFSVNLQNSTDPRVVSVCLQAMKCAIRIAARFRMTDERETLIDALTKFTLLDAVREMETKNIECIQTLLSIAFTEGDYLDSSWAQVLMCISQLARLQLYVSGGNRSLGDDRFFADSNNNNEKPRKSSSKTKLNLKNFKRKSFTKDSVNGSSNSTAFASFFTTTVSAEEKARMTDEDNAGKIAEKIDPLIIDRLFLHSVNLSTTAIVAFVEALCDTSCLELQRKPTNVQVSKINFNRQSVDSQPRIFSLQRIVEVADFNMGIRPRYVWSKVWSVLAAHFVTVGCHTVVSVSMYGVDSLRQLSMKFLTKDEFAGFNFQTQFLKPFEVIVAQASSAELREFVLRCVENMLLSKVDNIKSGWHAIICVIKIGSKDPESNLVEISFNMLKQILQKYITLMHDNLPELIDCLLSFCSCSGENTDISIEAILLVEELIHQLARGELNELIQNVELKRLSSASPTNNASVAKNIKAISSSSVSASNGSLWYGKSQKDLVIFLPIMNGLAVLIGDDVEVVRSRAMKTFFSILNQYSSRLSPQIILSLFQQTIFPMFSIIRKAGNKLSSTLNHEEKIQADIEVAIDETKTSKEIEENQIGVVVEALIDNPNHLETTCMKLLRNVFETFRSLYVKNDDEEKDKQDESAEWKSEVHNCMEKVLINDFLPLLEDLILRDIDSIARIGVAILAMLLNEAGGEFTTSNWTSATSIFENTLTSCLPLELNAAETNRWLGLTTSPKRSNVKVTTLSDVDSTGMVKRSRRLSQQSEVFEDEETETASELSLDDNDNGEDSDVNNTGKEIEDDNLSKASGMVKTGSWEAEKSVSSSTDDNLPFDSAKVLTMCIVQLSLLQCIGESVVANFQVIGQSDRFKILVIFETSSSFARTFNDMLPLRVELLKRDFMQAASSSKLLPSTDSKIGNKTPPNLLRQESTALNRYIEMLFKSVELKSTFTDDALLDVEERMKKIIETVFNRYLHQDKVLTAEQTFKPTGLLSNSNAAVQEVSLSEAEAQREIKTYTPLVMQVLRSVLSWSEEEMVSRISWLFPHLTCLIEVAHRDVHAILRMIFDKHISLFIPAN